MSLGHDLAMEKEIHFRKSVHERERVRQDHIPMIHRSIMAEDDIYRVKEAMEAEH